MKHYTEYPEGSRERTEAIWAERSRIAKKEERPNLFVALVLRTLFPKLFGKLKWPPL